MEFGFTTAAYVVAAVLFILSLGGLSGQESAKRAVWYGIVGMALAVFATLASVPARACGWLSLLLIAGGGLIGYQLSSSASQMTEMPQLVAGDALAGRSGSCLCRLQRAFRTGQRRRGGDGRKQRKRVSEGFAALMAKKSPVEISILRVEAVPGYLHRRRHLYRVGDRLWQAGGQGDLGGDQTAGRSHAERRRSGAER